MADPRNYPAMRQVQFGLWLLKKFPGQPCEKLDKPTKPC